LSITGLMGALRYHNGVLYVEDVPVSKLAAEFGTPLYVYSARVLEAQYRRLEKSLRGVSPNVLICYALKANANDTLGQMLASWGAGADVVSGGEIYLARLMGFPGERIVFAGVGKTRREIEEALAAGVRALHVESAGELEAIASVAATLGMSEAGAAPVAVRVNPDVDAHTHPYITTGTRADKFGVSPGEALDLMRRAAANPYLLPVGLHAHVGSQLPRVQPVVDATARLVELWKLLAGEGIHLRELDIGGGLGIPYRPGDSPEGPEELATGLRPLLAELPIVAGHRCDLVLEPGRFIVGPAGALLTSITYMKETASSGQGDAAKSLAIVDAGMNDLLRPALYGAYHPVWPLQEETLEAGDPIDIVGPVCESSDVLARDRRLGVAGPGDILAIGQAGAYGFSMSSQYNARPRPAEVLVTGTEARVIRARESYADLMSRTVDDGVKRDA
jgi:diaminopimelate decarboxylase